MRTQPQSPAGPLVYVAALAFAATAILAGAGALTASAGATNMVYGTVQHVSTNNIKVAVAHTE